MASVNPTADYKVLIYAMSANFGAGTLIAEIENLKNLGWSEYANDVGEAFFTISQSDPKATVLKNAANALSAKAHVRIFRNGEFVWGGWLGEVDETAEDAIISAHSYLSGLYTLHTNWAQNWTAATVKTIITDVWNRARTGLSDSRMQWMTTGTMEGPVTTSGGAVELIVPLYKTYRKRILFVLRELAALSISDTTNKVQFRITPLGVFELYKNRGSVKTSLLWDYGGGEIADYQRQRLPVNLRNVLYGVGSSPQAVALQSMKESAADRAFRGRLEDTIFLSTVRDQTELDRVTQHRLLRAGRLDSDLSLTFLPGRVHPPETSAAGYNLLDSVKIRIVNGLTDINETRLVVGHQTVLYRGEEFVKVLLRSEL